MVVGFLKKKWFPEKNQRENGLPLMRVMDLFFEAVTEMQ